MNLRIWFADLFRPRTLGEQGEALAARYLKRRGFKIVSRQDRSRIGELDLVAVEDRTIVFVEVKTRRSASKGQPAEAVDDAKQFQLTRAALAYLKTHGLLEEQARFDVITVIWPPHGTAPQLDHFRDAFSAKGPGSQFFR
jgi:putative endonuclease